MNNEQIQNQPTNVPTQPPPSTPSPPPLPSVEEVPRKSHFMLFIFLFTLIIFLILGYIIFYNMSLNNTSKVSNYESSKDTSTQITQAASPTPDEEIEVQNIDIGDVEKDLKDIDTDVGQL